MGLPSNHGNYGSKRTLPTHAGKICPGGDSVSNFCDQHQDLVDWDPDLYDKQELLHVRTPRTL